MKLCLIGKYPPIQGGVSSQTYWLARGLARLGHEVHCVTNADEVEPSYRMYLSPEDRRRLACRLDGVGSVTVHGTSEPRDLTYIPYANPFVTKLAALATEVVEEYECHLILAWYLEPYGFAGLLASRWAGVPFALRHAGSDLARLAQQADRARAYRELLREADLVLTGAPMVRSLASAGVNTARLQVGAGASWPSEFSPQGPVLDIPALLDEVRGSAFAAPLPATAFEPARPTIGMYGKIGTVKGTPHLIDALAQLDASGCDFNVAFMCGVAGNAPAELLEYVHRRRLEHRTVLLPFVAPWRVPEFLRACTAVAVLEHRFPIEIHQPTTALEVLSTGTCLVVSDEILAKQPSRHAFFDGENVLVVDDPRDRVRLSAALRRVIDEPATAARIGTRGSRLFETVVDRSGVDRIGKLVERLELAVERRSSTVSLQAFQGVLAHLYTNAAFRAAVRESEAALDDHDLTEQERAAAAELVSMHEAIDGFAEELHLKAFDFAWKHFPTVDHHFAGVRPAAFRLFQQRFDFRDRGWPGNVEYVAELIEAVAREGIVTVPPCFRDVIRYDLGVAWAATTPLPSDRLEGLYGAVAAGGGNGRSTEDGDRFAANPALRIVQLEHDIPALLAGCAPANVPQRPVTLAFVPSTGMSSAVAVALAPGAEELVRAAGTGATVDDLVLRAAELKHVDPEAPGFRGACVRAIRMLLERGVLERA